MKKNKTEIEDVINFAENYNNSEKMFNDWLKQTKQRNAKT